MRWSVGIEAEGDRVLSREEIVELADAVAVSDGIATGIGTNHYGAQLVVQAGSRDEAIEKATGEFGRAVAKAGLPAWPVTTHCKPEIASRKAALANAPPMPMIAAQNSIAVSSSGPSSSRRRRVTS